MKTFHSLFQAFSMVFNLHNTLYLIMYFVIFLLAFPCFPQENKSEYYLGFGGISINSADIDKDEDLDLIVGHHSGDELDTAVTILFNSGNGVFNEENTVIQFVGYQWRIFGQNINNDIYPEIVAFKIIPAIKSYMLRVLINSNGTFNQYEDYILNGNYNRSTYGDVNGDGKTDIVISSSNSQSWGVFVNNGMGQFYNPEYYDVTEYWPSDIECGNLNDDNMNDVLLTGAKTEIYFSNESGFQGTLIDDQPNHEVEIADMDNDGDNDIIALRCWGNTSVFIYENIGSGNFIKHTSGVYNEFYSYYFDVGDLNNDLLPDAVLTTDFGIYIVFNNGDFSMGQAEFYPTNYVGGPGWGCSHCCDLNSDGYTDIASIIPQNVIYETVLTLFYNDGNGNFVPEPPTNISEYQYAQDISLNSYPNPFKSTTVISFFLEHEELVELEILDVEGKPVSSLLSCTLKKGQYHCTWDGYNFQHTFCKPGIYFCYLKTKNKSFTLKLLLTN